VTHYVLPQPERFTVGTIGAVGQRTFLLQMREGRQLVTIKVEKMQVATVSAYLTNVVKEMGRPKHLPDDLALEDEHEPDFALGDVSVAIDEDAKTITLVLDSIDSTEDDDGDEVPMDRVTVTITREQAAAFAIHATVLVEGGRPPCPLCALPIDPRGHDCPRTNGFKAPIT